MFDPLKDVFPVASAPSKLALFRFACWRKEAVLTFHANLIVYITGKYV